MKVYSIIAFIGLLSSGLFAEQFHKYQFDDSELVASLNPNKRNTKYYPARTIPKKPIEDPSATFTLNPPFSKKLKVQRIFSPDSTNPHRGMLFRYSDSGHVCSSMEGTVVEINYMDGYENYVIVEHTDGFSTVYANLDLITVSKGQNVSKGQMLGTLTKNKGLYFQVNKGSKAVNPVRFLKI